MPSSTAPTAPPRLKPHELADLTTYSDMLHLIHHRNLNQHRHSIWWRSFSVFRRELSHFLSEYTTYQPPAAATAPVSKPSAKASKAAARRAAARLEAWKKDAVPRWYLCVFSAVSFALRHAPVGSALADVEGSAFTEVVASTQFSAIGLVLLAVLARVTHVTGITAAYEAEAERAMQAMLREFAEKDARELFGGVEAGQSGARKGAMEVEDLGEVVGRREDLGEVLTRDDDVGEAVRSGVEEKSGVGDKKVGKKKKERQRGDESKVSTPATDVELVARVDTKEVAVRKKKKKEKRVAEPSPEPEPEIREPPKKKKKTKKASAIDDLFAGL
ncbi:Ribonuclease MRP protein subunit rmp1 [Neofusicoccum ribis]|uniref:Ribonuclease MRP protein subunit rmp1 n=1 Tax=Neofusicoccum ribis TaxID=45134 RepID=A0ABR3SFW1_9PEZI